MSNFNIRRIEILVIALISGLGCHTEASIILDNTSNGTVLNAASSMNISTSVSRGLTFKMAQADYQLDSIRFAAEDSWSGFSSVSPTQIQWSLYLADALGNPTGGALGSWTMDLSATPSYHTLSITDGTTLLRDTKYLLFASATRMTKWFTSPTQSLPASDVGMTEINFRDTFSGSWADSMSINRGLIQINGTFAGGTPYDGSGDGSGNDGGSSPIPEPFSVSIWITIAVAALLKRQRLTRTLLRTQSKLS